MLAIKSKRIVLTERVTSGGLLIKDGNIVDIVAPQEIPADYEVYDVGEHAVMAGAIDVHVHINEPGRVDWEGFETATQAAVAGGTTTVIEMPLNSMPVTTNPAAWEAKVAAAQGQLWVNVGLHAGIIPPDLHHLSALLAQGAMAGKAFMVDSGMDDYPPTSVADLARVMPTLAAAGRPLFAHAELDLGADTEGDPREYATYLASRPPSWEVAAIDSLIDLCRQTGCHVHIVHLSAAEALPRIRAAKAAGLPLTVETAPHYLLFAAEEIQPGRTEFKCAPPIRSGQNRALLWEAVADGTIDLIATDHSPCPPALKRRLEGDFLRAWGGITSLQLLLSATWTASQTFQPIALTDLSRLLSAHPADLMGLTHRGRLRPGAAADIVIWDPEATWTVDGAALYHRHSVTPYHGYQLRGQVIETFVNGMRIYQRGVIDPNPCGKLLLRLDSYV